MLIDWGNSINSSRYPIFFQSKLSDCWDGLLLRPPNPPGTSNLSGTLLLSRSVRHELDFDYSLGPINQFFKAPPHAPSWTEPHPSIHPRSSQLWSRPVVSRYYPRLGGFIHSRFCDASSQISWITKPLSNDSLWLYPSWLIPTPSSTSREKSCHSKRRGLFL